MIGKTSLERFLSGRVLGLLGSLGFQIALVRVTSTPEYARYALAIALAALLQTTTSFGLARVSAKFLSGAGERMSHRASRKLIIGMLAFRMSACLVLLAASGVASAILRPDLITTTPLICAGAAYALASTAQVDGDGIAQALGLQTASRHAAVGEPLARLLGVLGFALAGSSPSAVAVLWLSAGTAVVASALLVHASLQSLSSADPAPNLADAPPWKEIRKVAVGGYGGTLSWLAFSPAAIRLIASRILPIDLFAGFSFVQTLAVSLQRYAPSFTLFPLIEPAVMADVARTGRPDRLRAALSLLVKMDAIIVGAAIVGVSVAGAPGVRILAHGKYGEAAVFLPWLLAAVAANASHRSYEIAAVAVDVAGALTRALGFTLVWLAVALCLTPVFGVWPLLVCPLGDALTRFWFVQRALTRSGASDVIDFAGLSRIVGVAVAASLVGVAVSTLTHADAMGSLCIGALAALGFLVAAFALRLVGDSEVALLKAVAPRLDRWLGYHRQTSARSPEVVVLTPRGLGGVGGVDRLMDSLRQPLADAVGASVTFLTTRGPTLWTSPFVSGWTLVRLAGLSMLGRVDVIHVNLGANGSCYRKMALIAIPRLLKVPYVLHLHGSAFASFWSKAPPFARRRIDRLFNHAARVIVLGEVWRRLVEERLPEVSSRIIVLPNATPALTPSREWRDADQVQILFLGELGPRKGSPTLIEALSRLEARTPWRAVLAGDGGVMEAKTSVRRLGLENCVNLPGWVGPDAVASLLAASDILVLPSFEENMPMAVIEAFAAGLAVIATPVGALPDILSDGETALVTTPGDVTQLACALDALIDDPPLRRRLGDAARAFHAEHLALDPYIDRLVDIWKTALRP